VGVYNYLTIAEAAQKINLSRNYVSRLCGEGRFEGAVKVGRAWLIPAEAVEAYSKDNSKFIQAWGRRKNKFIDDVRAAITEAKTRKEDIRK